ncbi:MAG: transporter substrate-binding domain-containing protein [Oscillospiraceae bacterium]|jgi:polar amino acid transport system substrate-binding protein|nr:transporter substrate-binding domain-containing protein [Oscillospiraceae bacterium]
MKRIIAILLALVCVAALVSCKKSEKMVIGITEYEPMNYKDSSGKWIGFDTEFAEAACKKLGRTPEFKVIDWETKEIELKAGNIDCIWNGLTVTEERRENMAFTSSYLINEQAIVVKAENAAKYTDKASFAGASFVAESESAGQTAVESDFPDAKFTAVESQAMTLLEVKAGTADAAVIDVTMARAMTGAGTDYADLVIVTGISLTNEEYAIGFKIGSEDVAKFNDIIKTFRSDGTLSKLAEKYGVADLLIK